MMTFRKRLALFPRWQTLDCRWQFFSRCSGKCLLFGVFWLPRLSILVLTQAVVMNSRLNFSFLCSMLSLICIRSSLKVHQNNRVLTLSQVMGDNNSIACRWTFQGTFKKAYQGFQPNGHKISWQGVTVYHVENGMITSVRSIFDTKPFYEALSKPEAK